MEEITTLDHITEEFTEDVRAKIALLDSLTDDQIKRLTIEYAEGYYDTLRDGRDCTRLVVSSGDTEVVLYDGKDEPYSGSDSIWDYIPWDDIFVWGDVNPDLYVRLLTGRVSREDLYQQLYWSTCPAPVRAYIIDALDLEDKIYDLISARRRELTETIAE